MMEIQELASKQALEKAFEVMKELRPHLDFATFFALYQAAKKADDYRVVGLLKGGEVVAVMGYRQLHDLVRGQHLYIDDLVTTAAARSTGAGAKLLQFAEGEAKRLGCKSLRLCTGIDNDRGKKFYEREGWVCRSIAYVKAAPSNTPG